MNERPLDIALDGHLLIQASAGTGKTYALTTLVARLLVEAGNAIDELLVVTFTNAATGELRDRLRRTLAQTLARLRAADHGAAKDQAADLVARWEGMGIDRADAAASVAHALQGFDRANVATIHAFCQRALTEFAFDSALPFGFELGGDDTLDVAAAVRDYWRVHMADAQAPLLEIARDSGFTPGELADWTRRQLANPDAEVRGAPDPGADFEERFRVAFAVWMRQTNAVGELWPRHGAEFVQTLADMRWRKTSIPKIAKSCGEARAVFEGGTADALPLSTAMYLAPSNLGGILLKQRPPQEFPPGNPLFDGFEALGAAAQEVHELSTVWLRAQRRRVLEETRERLARRAWEERRLSFNDLLAELHSALEGDRGEVLAARIRERYPRALIDEFQDTDRLQARIFSRIYPVDAPTGSLTVVGDPKQSIYRFRGADVFAYIRAAEELHGRTLQLDRNYRSTPGLVRAVNAVFARQRPFLLPQIDYEGVQAATDRTAALALPEGMDPAAFQIRVLPPFKEKPRKDEAVEVAAAYAASEIASLLGGEAAMHGRPLVGADIAVLVRTARQGQAMASALRAVGVQCVEMDDTSVFNTVEAADLRRLLSALADDAGNGGPFAFAAAASLKGALAADLFGLRLQGIAALPEDDGAWALWHNRAASWRRIWSRSGIAALIRHLLFDAETDCARHLLRAKDGLRRLTNVLHLADLLRQAESRERLAPAGLVEWFARQDPEQRGDEATQLRLESDEGLVRVITMHRSKGLEFPIVFLPFAWYRTQPRRRDEPSAEYHDREREGFPPVLDLDPSDDAKLAEGVEDQSDELRLFYVAVTRAQYRCVATWAPLRDSNYAPLAWLVHGGDAEHEPPEKAYKTSGRRVNKLSEGQWREEVQALADAHDDIAVTQVAELVEAPANAGEDAPALAARRLDRKLARVRQMTSYSALAAEAGAAISAAEHDAVEAADHDREEESEQAATPEALDKDAEVFTFPRGPRAGDCLHGILEESFAASADLAELAGQALRRWRIGEEWAEVAEQIAVNARMTPLAGSGDCAFRLADLSRPIPEMEFRLPAEGLDRRRLGACLQAHGYPHPFGEGHMPKVDGFLQGFIDLVARHDGRWYVLDYKSNWLGDGLSDYSQDALRMAMEHHGYHLQYLLYLTALHRMLALRLPDYDYDRHVGGACYLFLRAMRPGLPGHGVFHDRPSRECIEAIDACFRGEEA